MDKINLQQRTKPLGGEICSFWFENDNIGLQRTLFFRVVVFLEPFDSGLLYVSQPEETEIVIDWIKLDFSSIASLDQLDKLEISNQSPISYESTIYIGSAHNPIDFVWLRLERSSNDDFLLSGRALINFKHERVAEDEYFEFTSKIKISLPA